MKITYRDVLYAIFEGKISLKEAQYLQEDIAGEFDDTKGQGKLTVYSYGDGAIDKVLGTVDREKRTGDLPFEHTEDMLKRIGTGDYSGKDTKVDFRYGAKDAKPLTLNKD